MNKGLLKEAGKLWKEVDTPEAGTFDDIPDGKYTGELVEATIQEREMKDEKRLQISMQWKLLGPTNANRRVWVNLGLWNDQGVEITKRTLATLDVDIPDEIEDLPDVLDKMTGIKAELNLRTKTGKDGNKYQNTYVNKLLDDEAGEGSADDEEEAPPTKRKKDEEELDLRGVLVSFKDGKKSIQGKVIKQLDGVLTIKDVAGDRWEVDASEITIVEEEEDEEDEDAKPAKKVAKKVSDESSDDDDKEEDAEEEEPEDEDEEEVKPTKKGAVKGKPYWEKMGLSKETDLLGKNVTFKDDKKNELVGAVVSIGESITVLVDDEEWEVERDDIKLSKKQDEEENGEEEELEEEEEKKPAKKIAKKTVSKKK
jgi:hypothetical protein